MDVVKEGWSWPGFFFTWIWAYVKGLNIQGTVMLAVLLGAWALDAAFYIGGLHLIVGLTVAVVVGANGNEWWEAALRTDGYRPVRVEGRARPSPPDRYCSGCGTGAPWSARYCSRCGRPLLAPEPVNHEPNTD